MFLLLLSNFEAAHNFWVQVIDSTFSLLDVHVHNAQGQCIWWRHQMETFPALLAICEGNSPVTGEFPSQRPVTWSFDVFFDLRLNKRVSKRSWDWWFETPSCILWRHCNDTCTRLNALGLYAPMNWVMMVQVMTCCLFVVKASAEPMMTNCQLTRGTYYNGISLKIKPFLLRNCTRKCRLHAFVW